MSAFRIDKEGILYLVQAAQSKSFGRRNVENFYYYHEKSRKLCNDSHFVYIAQLLDIENAKSLFSRYSDFSRLYDFKESDFSRPLWREFDPIQVLKSIDFFIYQSCEHEGYRRSEAYSFLMSLKNQAISCLPGYNESKWGMPEKERENGYL